jgi:thiol:disulfide interchange protein DsbD
VADAFDEGAMNRVQGWFLGLAAILLVAVGARSQGVDLGGFGGDLGFGLGQGGGERVNARAVASVEPLVPGKPAEVGVEITIEHGWHLQSATAPRPYIATRLVVSPAEGLTFGPVRYPEALEIPAPAALGGGTLSVYEGKVQLLVPVTVSETVTPGTREVELALTVQACDDKSCLPPRTIAMKVPVRVGAPGEPQKEIEPALFTAARKQKFTNVSGGGTATAPAPVGGERGAEGAAGGHYAGVTLLSDDQQVALIRERNYKPFNQEELSYSIWGIVLLALVGGMILNVMPCVLPVIPLKVLSLVQQAHGDRRLAVMHGLTFSAGVVALFVALAIVLRTFGLFYGQQFQSPAFLVVMAFFVVALALSMLNVWTIQPPQVVYEVDAKIATVAAGGEGSLNYAGPGVQNGHRHAYLGSFGNGLMATLLATPCSAPYLGPVLAWALVQPAWLTALALALVGVGMSVPYLVLAAFPGLLNRIPRAGRWSELLKQGLGIVMLGVAVYLIFLVPNVKLWPWVMLGAVVVALVCWAWGQIPTPQMARGRVWGIRIGALMVGTVLGLGLYGMAKGVGERSGTAGVLVGGDGQWVPFNVALLDAAIAEGRPVVVDWTADWCINCHVLEAAVLAKEPVQKSFRDAGALLLKADLSVDNPPATALNRKLGGEAIPVLAIFAPGRPLEPVVLRDSYTQARVMAEVTKAK